MITLFSRHQRPRRQHPWVHRAEDEDVEAFLAQYRKEIKGYIHEQRRTGRYDPHGLGFGKRKQHAFAYAFVEALQDLTNEPGRYQSGLPLELRPVPATEWDHLRAAAGLFLRRFRRA